MSGCQGEHGIVSLFQGTVSGEDERKATADDEVEVHVLDESFFHDKLDKTNIYNEEDEEVYIAASPSFSMNMSKQEMEPIYSSQNSTQLSDKDECEEHLKCDTAFSDISSDSHSVEYRGDTTNSYPVINNDGQSYFISSDYSSINNLGIELSKGYFYVLSPNTFGNAIGKSGSEDNLTQVVDGQTMMSSTPKEPRRIQPKTDIPSSSNDREACDSQPIESFRPNTPPPSTMSTNSITVSASDAFEPLSTDYVNFIPSIPDSPAKDQQSDLTWHKLVTSDSLTKRTEDIQNQLLMKYENNSSRMEVPLLNGQPYLQVALVNDLDTSPTSELVCADQILGVAVPKMVTCKWEGCGIHVFTNEELIQHVNNSHVTADCEQNYPCFWKGCIREGRPFNARYKMVIHLRTHTGEKPHRCSVKGCEASFGRIENMKIHTRSHTGEKPYLCPYEGCEKVFANSSDRFKHVRTHKEKKPFRCNVIGCDKSYTDPSSLRKHKKRHAAGFIPSQKKGKSSTVTIN